MMDKKGERPRAAPVPVAPVAAAGEAPKSRGEVGAEAP